jgi:hypothetical protein
MRDMPRTVPFLTTSAAQPEMHAALEELDALYPVVAYWTAPEDDPEPVAPEEELDEEVLDEAILAGLVALR